MPKSFPTELKCILISHSDPRTHIIGGPDMFVDVGSMVNLSCVVAFTERPPEKVIWFHNGIEISYRGPRTGVSVRERISTSGSPTDLSSNLFSFWHPLLWNRG